MSFLLRRNQYKVLRIARRRTVCTFLCTILPLDEQAQDMGHSVRQQVY